jgi:hypothetical protein
MRIQLTLSTKDLPSRCLVMQIVAGALPEADITL